MFHRSLGTLQVPPPEDLEVETGLLVTSARYPTVRPLRVRLHLRVERGPLDRRLKR